MKFIYALLVIFIFTFAVFADETGGKFYIGVKGGIATYAGDIDQNTVNFYGEGNVGYWFTNYLGLGFNYGNAFLKAEDDVDYFQTWVTDYSFLLKLKLLPKSSLNPYLTAGYSIIDINPKNSDDIPLPNRLSGKYDKQQSAIPIGIGFSYFLTDILALDLEGIYHICSTDYLDDLDQGSKNDGWGTAAIGLSLYLGKPKDTDGDGIIDKIDMDPTHAEDFDGFEDTDGKPEWDNDNDGVLDADDKAPLDPEDKDSFQDNDGIPDPDNDGDGIVDVNDKCPGTDSNLDTKEDMDGFEDEDGCPDLDNDGDGIADVNDKCPNEAEVFNEYDDDDGCPDTKPEIAVEKGKAIILEGINFASGSSTLSNSSMEILDKVFTTLEDNPNLEVEIRGYTDNTGKYENNVSLSQRRADAVKQYLVYKGIDNARISTKGFGPADPIAPNDTKEGRAKNRRIEFFRIK